MRYLIALVAMLLGLGAHARDDLTMNVTLDYDQERDNVATQTLFSDLARSLSHSIGVPVKLIMTQNAERMGERIRNQSYSILLAPAQLVGVAMRSGYLPVARSEQDVSVVLVARRGANVTTLENARGKRIVLPHRESLVSYMVRSELNALGLSPSTYFSSTSYMNKYGAVLYTMEIGEADIAAMKDSIAREWISHNGTGTVIKSFTKVPLAGVMVSDKLDEGLRGKIRVAFTTLDKDLQHRLTVMKMSGFEPADKADFDYVASRGLYTPEVLPGAVIATAEMVKGLIAQGVKVYDVRPHKYQYVDAHIPGAPNLPYVANSPKEADYDDSVDVFDISKLPQDKNTPMIFQCNGPECWYSYKASRYMIKRGYKKVYWFRTGLPAWKAAGYSVQHGM